MHDWLVRREDGSETAVGSIEDLRKLYRDGSLRRSDYVFHPVLQRWLYAKDLEELTEHAPVIASQTDLPPLGTLPSAWKGRSSQQPTPQQRVGSTVTDGVKLGCGMFVILPIILALFSIAALIGVAMCAGAHH